MFSRKRVFGRLLDMQSRHWKSPDPKDNQFDSALKLLKRAESAGLGPYAVESIPLPQHEGYEALAFCVPAMLEAWNIQIREVIMDSVCKFRPDIHK